MRNLTALTLLLILVNIAGAQSAPYAAELEAIVKQGRGTAEGRAAWDKLVRAGPKALESILLAMNGKDTVASNWLRLAFDQIVQRELQQGGRNFDVETLLVYAQNLTNQGRARRLALELVEELKPGTTQNFLARWENDDEFRHDAVALMLKQAADDLPEAAKTAYQKAFAASRDIQQAHDAAAGLAKYGETVSVAAHLGFLMDWRLIGPFDGNGQKGFRTEYPPEKRIDLAEEVTWQTSKLRWKPYRVQEPPPKSGSRHQALVNLREKDALGDADDAVAFAYTEFTIDKARVAELRGAADDNFTIWVNGERVFGFEEWRNGVRHDRHRVRVKLREGKNTVLVKVCQTAAPNPEPNWEFFLRVVDDSGRGIAMRSLFAEPTPPEKKDERK